MPTITNTDNSRLDLSEDEGFNELLKHREELSEIILAGHEAYRERVEIDAEIINRMGNAKTALAGNDLIVSVQTMSKKEYTVQARVVTFLKIRTDKIRRWRRRDDLKTV